MRIKLLMIVGIAIIFSSAFAEESEPQISVQTNDSHYTEGDLIVISGNVTDISGPIVGIQILHNGTNVNGSTGTIALIADDGTFTTTITAGGESWEKSRGYIARATYNDDMAETTFSYTDLENKPSGNTPKKHSPNP